MSKRPSAQKLILTIRVEYSKKCKNMRLSENKTACEMYIWTLGTKKNKS